MKTKCYRVRAANPDPKYPIQLAHLYGVYADYKDRLCWTIPDRRGQDWTVPLDGTEIRLKRCGWLAASYVTPEEAEALTGLSHPMAAMDRLRDLVHEAPDE